MKKKIISIIVVLVIMLAIIANNKPEENPNGKPTVKIGVTLPLTGKIGTFIGNNSLGALEIAKEDLKAMDIKYNYEFIVEDHQFDAKRISLINNKFIHQDNVDAIISMTSKAGNIIADEAEKNKIIHIGFATADKNVARGKYNFIHWTQADKEVNLLVEELQNREINKTAVIMLNDSWAQSYAPEIKQKFDAANISHDMYNINPGQTDFKVLISKMKLKDPQIYIVFLFDDMLINFINQLRAQGVNAPLTSISIFNAIDDKSVLEGSWFVQAAELKNKELMKRINDKNENTATLYIGNIYDIVMLLVDAFDNADDTETVIDNLLSIKEYNGEVGHLRQDEEGVFQSEATLRVIKNGRVEVLEE